MAVKSSHSGSRVLAVLEAIANQQPIGVRALGRLLDVDKSAIQRALATLSEEGWIRTFNEPPVRWELTERILTVAQAAQGNSDLRQRVRPVLERLRDDTGETILLTALSLKNFVIVDVIESRQVLRMVPHVGDVVSVHNTATSRAILPFMNPARQIALLGRDPDQALTERFEQTLQRGFAISVGEINPGSTCVAAPILDLNGYPIAAIVVCGLTERLAPPLYDQIGEMLVQAARAV